MRRLHRYVMTAVLSLPLMLAPPVGVQAEERQENQAEKLIADDLISLNARKAAFKIVQGKNEGARIPMTLSSSPARGVWRVTFENLYALRIRKDPDGDVRVEDLVIHEENQRIVFDPPVTMIPGAVRAGMGLRRSGTAVIHDGGTGAIESRGRYVFTLKDVSRADFHTPAGRMQGYLIEYNCRINLDLSLVRIELESGWSDERKLVYWHSKHTIDKLGFFGTTTLRTLELAERTAPRP